MGRVYAEITVKNAVEVEMARNGQIPKNKVRTVTLTAIVDTGATTLVINEDIFNQLGLSEVDKRNINIAGGGTINAKVTSPVNIHWKDRFASINAVVMPQQEPLLGVVPLEFLDLIVDPVRQELVGAHGDKFVLMAM